MDDRPQKERTVPRRRRILAFVAAWAAVAAPAAGETVVTAWNEVALQSIRDLQPGPAASARALALTHDAIYDAWAAYDSRAVGTQFGGALRRPGLERTDENRTEAISYAAFETLLALFPEEESTLRQTMADRGYRPGWSPSNPSLAALVGHRAAGAVLRRAALDGAAPGSAANEALGSTYVPVNGPDLVVDPSKWHPLTYVDVNGATVLAQQFASADFGTVTPFALANGSELRPPPPPRYGSRAFNIELQEVVNLQALLSDRQKTIAEYWSDGAGTEYPPGHWNLIARWVSERDQNAVGEDARLFFALNNALFDASIAVWDAKRTYDSVRPISAVRSAFRGRTLPAWGGPGGGTQTIPGELWIPYQPVWYPSPASPEHVSDHSALAEAAAVVLRRQTGSDRYGQVATIEAGSSVIEPAVTPRRTLTLQWPSFTAAAREAAVAGRYGGIDFRSGDLQGRALGRRVGARVATAAWKYFSGTARRPPAIETELPGSD